MTLRIFGLVILLGAILVTPSTAQPSSPAKPSVNVLVDKGYATIKSTLGEAELQRQLYEDIEIMRRLLERNITPPITSFPGMPTPGGGGAMMSAMGMGGGMSMGMGSGMPMGSGSGMPMGGLGLTPGFPIPIQGFYLRGHGVVFSLSLPVTGRKVVGESTKPSPPPLSDWERVRKELRGEKPEAPARRQPEDSPLSDAILKVLAQNGHHFSQLGEQDHLTVVVAFGPPTGDPGMGPGAGGFGIFVPSQEGGTGAMSGAMSPMGGMMGPAASGGSDPMGVMSPPGGRTGIVAPGGGFSAWGASGKGSAGVPYGGPSGPYSGAPSSGSAFASSSGDDDPAGGFRSEARKHSLLGDLHMKQAQFQQARDMYAKAVDACKKALEKRGTAEYRTADSLVELELVEHLTKLGQAWQGQARNEQARKILQEIAQLTQRASSSPGTAPAKPPAGPRSMPLYNRLTISASKKLLEEVGTGKMTFDDFRKKVIVEYLDFSKPASEKVPIQDPITKPTAKP